MLPLDTVVLENDLLRCEISPSFGGSVLRLDTLADGQRHPILLPWKGSDKPPDRAMFVMLPWCNRISSGGFTHEGVRYAIRPNLSDQTMPIHGSAFDLGWKVDTVRRNELALSLTDRSVAPFEYLARLHYRLKERSLSTSLTLTHLGCRPVPYGIGLHPWFKWLPGDRLAFHALACAVENDERLPVRVVELWGQPGAGFSSPRSLPEGLMNRTFLNWRCKAEILRREGSSIRMRASGATEHLHLYSLGNESGFVCLEPVSHLTDALNRPLSGNAMPKVLAQGEALGTEMEIEYIEKVALASRESEGDLQLATAFLDG